MLKIKLLVAVPDHPAHTGPQIFNAFLLKLVDGDASGVVPMKGGVSTGNYHRNLCAELGWAI